MQKSLPKHKVTVVTASCAPKLSTASSGQQMSQHSPEAPPACRLPSTCYHVSVDNSTVGSAADCMHRTHIWGDPGVWGAHGSG
eukprot:171997-Pelagomonas_calceolata.AAC.1